LLQLKRQIAKNLEHRTKRGKENYCKNYCFVLPFEKLISNFSNLAGKDGQLNKMWTALSTSNRGKLCEKKYLLNLRKFFT
jgi:hypothetical protein